MVDDWENWRGSAAQKLLARGGARGRGALWTMKRWGSVIASVRPVGGGVIYLAGGCYGE